MDEYKVSSQKSNLVTYIISSQILNAPLISLNNRIVSWNTINNAEQYEIYVDDVLVDTVSSLTYEVNKSMPGSYEINIKAITSDPQLANSEYSNTVTYFVPVSLSKPLLVQSLKSNSYLKINTYGYLGLTSNAVDADSVLLESVVDKGNNAYRIRLQNGKYLRYVTPYETLNKDGSDYIYEEFLDINDDAFIFLFVSNKETNTCKFTNLASQKYYGVNTAYLSISSNDDYLRFYNEFTAENDADSRMWNLFESFVDRSSFANPQLKKSVDLTKPVLAKVGYANNNLLQLKTGFPIGTLLESFLGDGVAYSKYSDQSSYLSSAWQFEAVNYTPAEDSLAISNGWIVPSEGNFYRIKLTDGRYLAFVNGYNVGIPNAYFFSPTELDSQSTNFIFQLISVEGKENTFRIHSVGMNLQSQTNDMWLCYTIYQGVGYIHTQSNVPGYESCFEYTFNNINGAIFADTKNIEISGENNIISQYVNAFYYYDENYIASADCKYIRMGASYDNNQVITETYKFIFEKVTVEGYENTYRIKNSQGLYLTHIGHGALQYLDLNSDTSSSTGMAQVFLIKKIPGLINGYRISNIALGCFSDSIDGIYRPLIYVSNNNHLLNKQDYIAWDYITDSNWFIKEVK